MWCCPFKVHGGLGGSYLGMSNNNGRITLLAIIFSAPGPETDVPRVVSMELHADDCGRKTHKGETWRVASLTPCLDTLGFLVVAESFM
jgi:hypothetical protein